MSPTEQRRKAYAAARLYLEMRGFQIIEQNFRRSRTEIDVIAKKDSTIFFVSVSYHRHDEIVAVDVTHLTTDQVRRLKRGAAGWIEETKWAGDYQFSSVEIAGDNFTVMGFIDSLF